ncbi:MAG: PorT family protein [Bacteroidetes bacterium]|nr:PorT family protein [Bacteroidota bacterium]
MKQILIALFLLFAQSSPAQFRYGAELAGSYNKLSDNKNVWGATAITKSTFGGSLGILADYGITNRVYLQPGALFTMKSGNEEATTKLSIGIPVSSFNIAANGGITMKQESKFYYVEVPVNVLYKWGQPGGNRFFIGAGPYVAYGVAGKQTVKQDITADALVVSFDSSIRNTTSQTFADDSFGYQKLDYGFKVCEGYEFSNGLFLRAEFALGITNLSNYPDAKSRNMGFSLRVGYLFGDKPKKTQDLAQ